MSGNEAHRSLDSRHEKQTLEKNLEKKLTNQPAQLPSLATHFNFLCSSCKMCILAANNIVADQTAHVHAQSNQRHYYSHIA